jgi:hypothetical protein
MIIGIDPSVNKSGVAVIENNVLTLCEAMHLWDLFDFIKEHATATFYVENSNLDKANWHGATGRGNVGKNKGISQNIVNFIKENGYKLTELKPNGYSIRFYDKELFRKVTGFDKATNKDARAAACMIWGRK